MNIQDLEKILNQIAESKNIEISDIIEKMSDYAELRYSNCIEENDRKIIDTVKTKILKGLYKMPNHSYVTSKPNYKEKFKLDNLENEKVTHAVNELYSEGLIDGNENYAELTKNGILEVKILTGNL